MGLPFTAEAYFGAIEQCNLAAWPAQVVFYILAMSLIFLAARKSRATNVGLAFFWIWMGTSYFLRLSSSFGIVAYIFMALFIVQGFLFLKVRYKPGIGTFASIGGVLIIYAMVAYPLLGMFLGHGYPEVQLLGLPAPTAIFTLGLLLWAAEAMPVYMFVVPVLWSLVGTLPAFMFGTLEDFGLLAAGIAGAIGLLKRK
jgi:hypothetical protein